jgi:hypothetical protein
VAIHCFKEDIDQGEFLLQISKVCSIAEYFNVPIVELPNYLENRAKEYKDTIE